MAAFPRAASPILSRRLASSSSEWEAVVLQEVEVHLVVALLVACAVAVPLQGVEVVLPEVEVPLAVHPLVALLAELLEADLLVAVVLLVVARLVVAQPLVVGVEVDQPL